MLDQFVLHFSGCMLVLYAFTSFNYALKICSACNDNVGRCYEIYFHSCGGFNTVSLDFHNRSSSVFRPCVFSPPCAVNTVRECDHMLAVWSGLHYSWVPAFVVSVQNRKIGNLHVFVITGPFNGPVLFCTLSSVGVVCNARGRSAPQGRRVAGQAADTARRASCVTSRQGDTLL